MKAKKAKLKAYEKLRAGIPVTVHSVTSYGRLGHENSLREVRTAI